MNLSPTQHTDPDKTGMGDPIALESVITMAGICTILQPTFWDYAGKVIKEEVEIAIDNLTTTEETSEFKL